MLENLGELALFDRIAEGLSPLAKTFSPKSIAQTDPIIQWLSDGGTAIVLLPGMALPMRDRLAGACCALELRFLSVGVDVVVCGDVATDAEDFVQ